MSSDTVYQESLGRPAAKRRRPAVSCSECRRRKIACDRKAPCGQCALHKVDCVYGAGPVDRPAARKASNLPAQLAGATHGLGRRQSPAAAGSVSCSLRASDLRDLRAMEKPPQSRRPATTETGGDDDDDDDDDYFHNPSELESMFKSLTDAAPRLLGRSSKTRLFGQSHWINNVAEQFRDVHTVSFKAFYDPKSDMFAVFQRCKALGRAIKLRQLEAVHGPRHDDFAGLAAMLPSKQLADELIDLYLRMFEPVMRILHVPTFRDECRRYWDDASPPSDMFMAKLVLVMALGSCVFEGSDSLKDSLRIAATRVIHRADAWHCAALNKHRLNLDTVQVYCLVLLARQTSAVDIGDDLIWISAGSLLHTALMMGLHRDPKVFHGLTLYQAEMRRRLWATILELVAQSSLDSGMPPLINPGDYDCAPPSNIPDDRLSGNAAKITEVSLPDTVFTETLPQRILLRSLPTRLKIAKTLNGFETDQSYSQVLRLSQELTDCCRSTSAILKAMIKDASTNPEARPSSFQVKLIDLLTRRFFHSLHSPFAKRALVDLQYYYSRRMHLEAAIDLIAILAVAPDAGELAKEDDDSNMFRSAGRGLFKSAFIDASQTVCFELIQQLYEDSSPAASGLPMSLSRKELYQAARAAVHAARRRIEGGETNVKTYVFHAGALAQADAFLAGQNVHDSIVEAAKISLQDSLDILSARAARAGIRVPAGDQSAGMHAANDGGAAYSVADERTSTIPGLVLDTPNDDQYMDFCLGNLGINFDTPDLWLL